MKMRKKKMNQMKIKKKKMKNPKKIMLLVVKVEEVNQIVQVMIIQDRNK